MAEEILPAEHGGDFGDRLFFERARGTTAVERVIVGIDEHRESIGEARDRMRRLKHLAGVERVEIGIVVLKAGGRFRKDFGYAGGTGSLGFERWEIGEAGVELFGGVEKRVERIEINHFGASQSSRIMSHHCYCQTLSSWPAAWRRSSWACWR